MLVIDETAGVTPADRELARGLAAYALLTQARTPLWE